MVQIDSTDGNQEAYQPHSVTAKAFYEAMRKAENDGAIRDAVNKASIEFFKAMWVTLNEDRIARRIQTEIAGAASIAGLMLLRGTGEDLTQYEPGQVLLHDFEETDVILVTFIAGAAMRFGLEAKTGWTTPIPVAYQPECSVMELTQKLEGPFYEVCIQTGIGKEY